MNCSGERLDQEGRNAIGTKERGIFNKGRMPRERLRQGDSREGKAIGRREGKGWIETERRLSGLGYRRREREETKFEKRVMLRVGMPILGRLEKGAKVRKIRPEVERTSTKLG